MITFIWKGHGIFKTFQQQSFIWIYSHKQDKKGNVCKSSGNFLRFLSCWAAFLKEFQLELKFLKNGNVKRV